MAHAAHHDTVMPPQLMDQEPHDGIAVVASLGELEATMALWPLGEVI